VTVTHRWDAATYDRVADPQLRWGSTVLDRLPLRGDERVLDAGCGSGRVTEQLAERLPNGSIVALDASGEMLGEARKRLARFGDRIDYIEADLGRPLPIDRPVDAVLSTATFHWVPDHDALFHNLAAVLRPGGRLVAQCGGKGNIARFVAAVATVSDIPVARQFSGPEETAARLAASGFVEIDTWLQPEPTRFEPGAPFEDFLETVCLRQHVEGLPADERRAFTRAVAAELGEPVLDYIRLNIMATRSSG
jgi:trans-aconitate 2-methyltransferase